MIHEHDEEEETSSVTQVMNAETKERPGSRETLADLAIDAVLGRSLRRRIAANLPACIVIKVPEASWVEAIEDALAAINPRSIVIARAKAPLPRDREDGMLATRLESGRTVVGVSSNPDFWLPELLLDTAERRLEIPAPDAALVSKVLSRCQRGRVPPQAMDLDTKVLGFDQITSMIVSGGTAREAVQRMSKAIAVRTTVGTRREKLPRLEDAIEYGDARRWALDLRDDLADVRAGRIGLDSVDRGAVLHGPPGTGKTLLARMLGQELGIPVIVSSVAEWFATTGGYLNEVIKAQRKVFDEARAQAPALLFLDEINMLPNVDGLDGSRNKDYWAPLVLDFYTLLDGATQGRDGVIVIGATNRIEDINPAILRPGRLERAILVGPPDASGIENIMRHHLGADLVGQDLGPLAMLDANIGATGAVVMAQVRAARRAARRADRAITVEDLASQISPNDDRTHGERRLAAIHEAGHAVVGCTLGTGVLTSVSILKAGDAGGLVSFDDQERRLVTREDLDASVMTILAGRAAEELMLGKPSRGAGGGIDSDLARATRLVATVEGSLGLGSDLLFRAPPENAYELLRDPAFRARVEASLQQIYRRTLNLLTASRQTLVAVTEELLVKRFLSGDQVRSLIARHSSCTSTVNPGADPQGIRPAAEGRAP